MFKGTVYRTAESGCEGGGDTAHTPGHNHIIVLERENEFISHDFFDQSSYRGALWG